MNTEALVHPDTYVRGVPHELMGRLRREHGVVWVPEPPVDDWPAGPGFWAVLRHADVETVLRSPQVYSSSRGLTQIYDAPPPLLPPLRQMMINMDPPDHTRLRGLLAKAFAPRTIAKLEERIEAHARELVSAVAGTGSCDFARDIAADLPLLTLSEILGVPEGDRWLMFDWSNRVIGVQDAEYQASNAFDTDGATELAKRALAVRPDPDENGRMPDSRHPSGMADLYAYARELAHYRREHPGDDIMSLLLQQVDSDGGRVSNDEFEKLFWLFSVAGNETVRNAVPGGMYALLSHPDQYAKLRANPALVNTAVEEMLRWWSPVTQFRRTAAKDTSLAGVDIREGDKVVVYFASANRDDTVFADPDTFDITRDPNPHLAFGHGPHFCIAAQLARMQMRALFRAVLEQLGEVEADGEPERLRSNFQNGIKHLPIRWRPAAGNTGPGSWTYEHSAETAASPQAVWDCYQDTATWPEWNGAVGKVELDGPFAAGTSGQLSPPGQGPLPFRIISTTVQGGYVSETEIAETVTLRSTNQLTPLPDGRTRIHLRVDLVGAAAEYFGKSFGPQLTAGVPATVNALARRAEAVAEAGRS